MIGHASTRYPYPLYVYPSRFCNYRCSYCFTDSAPERKQASYLTANWHHLLLAASVLGVPEIRISGGEPLVLTDVEQLCRSVAAAGMRYTLTTNGSLLDRHLAWMDECPPETLWLSHHPEYQTHAALEAVIGRAAARLPRVGVNLFANDCIIAPDLLERVSRAGAARIKVLAMTPIGRARELELAPLQVRDFIAAVSERIPPHVEIRYETPDDVRGRSSCVLAVRPLLSIDGDGRAYACCITVGDHAEPLGDLRKEPLAAIVQRVLHASHANLPCTAVLPAIVAGEAGCPLRLETQGELTARAPHVS